ncbi:hypothetical protein PFICI_15141 [Pestalotiopsis fici W106-1]|uniref:F-box domain-containing protein n=1 Tax=Pestalotiopsis fici (strain W106-1 / CGMCC3.15140) TaxID=1229662 RepID=W3WK53_PESFW|nr:uncharacterized protein PFICI_15141 [Pestalotiopsis fici W106-1]ETS73196.1 hypothetical protein PFICI_15141 [Pestalotiopsis fici W106-1]
MKKKENEEEMSSTALEGAALVALPVDMIYQITDHLSIGSMAKLASTCKGLHNVIEPEIFRRDRNRGRYRTLEWAATSRKKHAIPVLQRALTLWPNGIKDLEIHFLQCRPSKHHGRTLRHKTPLLAAVCTGNLEVVAFLLGKGIDVHQTEAGNCDSLWSPIHWATMMDYPPKDNQQLEPPRTKLAIIELLLLHGANPDQLSAPNPRRQPPPPESIVSPMHLAIKNDANHHVVELLIKYGGAATQEPYRHVANQHYASISPISHLIDKYPNPTEDHCSSLRALATNGGGSGYEARKYTVTGQPLLLQFLSYPKESKYAPRFVRIMLKHTQARVEDTAANGDTAMVHFLRSHVHWRPAMAYDRRRVTSHEVEHSMALVASVACRTIDELVDHGAGIDTYGAGRMTPLHIACGLHCHLSSVFDHLIGRGANVKARTSRGHTLLHSLVMGDAEADFTLMTPLLKQYKIKRYARDNEGNTFLHLLVTQRLVLFGKWMSEAARHYKRSDFEDPKLRNHAGRTPLEEASFGSDANGEVTRFWIQHAFDERDEHFASKHKSRDAKRKAQRADKLAETSLT